MAAVLEKFQVPSNDLYMHAMIIPVARLGYISYKDTMHITEDCVCVVGAVLLIGK